MKSVSIQDLKKNLSSLIDEVSAGGRVVITRHGRPVASLVAPGPEHVHHGPLVGRGGPRPLLRRATRGRYLEVLAEDRCERDLPLRGRHG